MTNKHRKPYPRDRNRPKTAFTPAIWSRWLSEQQWAKLPPDRTTLRLREGIAEFRSRISSHRSLAK